MQDLGRIVCFNCKNQIRRNGRKLKCFICKQSSHLNCTSFSLRDYTFYISNNLEWLCQPCSFSIFPFHSIDNRELHGLSFNSNTNCLCSHNVVNSNLQELPLLQTISQIDNIPSFSDIDPEKNLPSKVNFDYFNSHDFHSSPEILNSEHKSFSILN
jgi:hypothetical protein